MCKIIKTEATGKIAFCTKDSSLRNSNYFNSYINQIILPFHKNRSLKVDKN